MKKLFAGLMMAVTLTSNQSFASALVCVDHEAQVVEVRAHYFYYGDEATDKLASDCTNEINSQWNNNAQLQFNKVGPWRKVKFNVTHTVMDIGIVALIAKFNKDARYNFVRIDTPPEGSKQYVSTHTLKANSGYFMTANGLGTSTTCAHEFGHGLGLDHTGGDHCDVREKGVPPIMAPRGCLVDGQYQYNPQAEPGKKGGTINPKNRKVSIHEIGLLNMGDLSYTPSHGGKTCAELGRAFNTLYDKTGERLSPDTILQNN